METTLLHLPEELADSLKQIPLLLDIVHINRLKKWRLQLRQLSHVLLATGTQSVSVLSSLKVAEAPDSSLVRVAH